MKEFINSLKEKVFPSLIAMILVGAFGAYVSQKVMASKIETLDEKIELRATITSVKAIEVATLKEEKELKCLIEKKASKEVQDIILNQVNSIDEKVDKLLMQK